MRVGTKGAFSDYLMKVHGSPLGLIDTIKQGAGRETADMTLNNFALLESTMKILDES